MKIKLDNEWFIRRIGSKKEEEYVLYKLSSNKKEIKRYRRFHYSIYELIKDYIKRKIRKEKGINSFQDYINYQEKIKNQLLLTLSSQNIPIKIERRV